MKSKTKGVGLFGPAMEGIRTKLRSRRQATAVAKWKRLGRPAPPHQVKQAVVLEYASKYQARVLVETGTFRGDMIEAMKSHFEEIYSIELSEKYFAKACDRFQACQHVKLILGDSGQELGKLLVNLKQPTLFWLDGHYSAGDTAQGAKDTPVCEELEHIVQSASVVPGHVIFIDDARCFGVEPSYPTLLELQDFLGSKKMQFDFDVEDDVIRITSLKLAAKSEAA